MFRLIRPFPVHRANRIIESSGAIAALTPDRIAEISNGVSPSARVLLDQDGPFYIIYTSGSTGDPKGVIITLRCLAAFLDWMLEEQGLDQAREVFLNQAPFSFDLLSQPLRLDRLVIYGPGDDEASSSENRINSTPSATCSPTVNSTSSMMPSAGAWMVYSTFIASIAISGAPILTLSPEAT
jgi:acyl-CoA synthetase (AMP-forming)/AMP-acid ligase II